jgi:multiple antibiotic resistance protein
MDENLLQFALTAFVTLIVVVDPPGVAPNFIALTSELGTVERNKILRRATFVAFGITLFFLLAGRWLLSHLGVTVHAFSISGGILLFVAAWPMLFGHRPSLQAPERSEQDMAGDDIAIFPLAIPLLSGPGTITTILLLSNRPDADGFAWRCSRSSLRRFFYLLVRALRLRPNRNATGGKERYA